MNAILNSKPKNAIMKDKAIGPKNQKKRVKNKKI